MGHSIHVIDGKHTIPDETGGRIANVYQIRHHVIDTAKDLIQDRSRLTSCDFLIANEKDPSRPRISVTACLDSNIASEPA